MPPSLFCPDTTWTGTQILLSEQHCPPGCLYRLCLSALMTGFKKWLFPDGDIAADARIGSFVWLTVAIWNLLNCDGSLPARVNGAYWKL
ncbi:hypothetical protein NUK31_22435, partial [Aeromonas caviae]|uniref:hypothetical protein n=1 Tax=Aeromonas caviae TaxID=648 RepID=UPI00214F3480